MTADQLTAILADRIMGWRVAPERFLMEGRRWAPRWRFQPLRRLDSARELVEKAQGEYTLSRSAEGTFKVNVRIDGRKGTASGRSQAAAITVALARAIGIAVPDKLLEAFQE